MPLPEPKPPQREPTQDKYRQLLGMLYGKARQEKKVSPPKEEKKDTSVFGGKQFATAEQRRTWLRRHASEVLSITKGRVTSSKVSEYEKKLNDPKKWGPFIEKYKHEPERIRSEMKKNLDKAKTDAERFDIKEDIKVVERMYGLEKK